MYFIRHINNQFNSCCQSLPLREGITAVEDVEGTKDKVDLEIAKLRAHDSETSGIQKTWLNEILVLIVLSNNFF